ncbi:MAG: AmmeMemoRadiSam system radical SAM enzyme [Nitrospirae bacterium]|nr:AmmeMemoRadiSam system radical SAM enzyme [Nitrospirota bacterium]
MKEAMFYAKEDEGHVRCSLCAHRCLIADGKRGICGARLNKEGVLFSLVYGKLVAMNIDPVEKKPLFHFMPATVTYSIAAAGCNFRCLHCQNFDISQYLRRNEGIPGRDVPPHLVIEEAVTTGCRSISYTYTEPTIFFEFALDCARIARSKGLKNIFVSNGYMSADAAREVAPFLDAINIDLKGDDLFYKKVCGARLQPVLDTISLMKELGVWVEITTLVIPSYNDSESILKGIAGFIMSVDPSIPWHVTQFYPTYKLAGQPRTPLETLRHARDIGYEKGLKFVYEGNVPGEGGENTFCPRCGELLIRRVGYNITENRIHGDKCIKCLSHIEGVWR